MSSLVWTPPRGEISRPAFPGWRRQEYVPLEIIEAYAEETLTMLANCSGGSVTFPVDAERLARDVFGLEVHYDDGSIMDRMDRHLLGCLYPDGAPCPATGKDRAIMVNDSPRFRWVTTAFTIVHECGHSVLHVPQDAVAPEGFGYCRTQDMLPRWSKVPPREWQASRFAAEVLMPKNMVRTILDGLEPGEVINLELYREAFRRFFGVSQAAMEKRLADLGYKYAFGRYAYANVTEVAR